MDEVGRDTPAAPAPRRHKVTGVAAANNQVGSSGERSLSSRCSTPNHPEYSLSTERIRARMPSSKLTDARHNLQRRAAPLSQCPEEATAGGNVQRLPWLDEAHSGDNRFRPCVSDLTSVSSLQTTSIKHRGERWGRRIRYSP